MNKMKRILALLFVVVLTVSVFSSCKNKGNGTTTTEPETSGGSVSPKPSLVEELLPKTDYGAKEFKIITMEGYNETGHLIQNEDSSNAIDEVAFKRTCYINERFNVQLQLIQTNDLVRDVKLSYTNNDQLYNLIYPHPTTGITTLMTEGLLADLNTFNDLHLKREWWNQSQVENYTTNHKLYLGVSDYTITGQGFVGLVYNKEAYAAFEFQDDLYQMVKNGKWTIEALTQLVAAADNNTNEAERTSYGLIFHSGYTARWMYALGENILEKKDNSFVRGFSTTQMVKIADKLDALVNDRPNVLVMNADNATFHSTPMWTSFASGESLFLTYDIGVLYPMLSELSFEIGYLPLPILGETPDEDYRVICAGGLLGIPSDTEDAVMSSVILEALSIYSYEQLRPTFYNTILNGRLSSNMADAQMLDFLHSKKFFDFGYTLDANGDAIFMLSRCVITDQRPDSVAGYIVSNKDLLDAIKDLANNIK